MTSESGSTGADAAVLDEIRQNRAALERLAASDLRCARYAEALLAELDEHEHEHEHEGRG